VLHALKGVGNRAFHRWLTRDYRPLFPRLPERTRLFRLFKTHQDWTRAFLAAPTVLGVIDTYRIELIHPIREGWSPWGVLMFREDKRTRQSYTDPAQTPL